MDNLKMKFKLHGLEFEIEGNEKTVKEEFANFKSFITADLLSKVNIVAPQLTTATSIPVSQRIEQVQEIETIEMTDFPAMKEIVKRDLPKTETDWILVYAFYSSQFGEETFTEKDIKTFYETTGRKNVSRTKNLSKNFTSLLKQEFIKVHNDTEYILKEKGLNYAKEILQGNSISKSVKRLSSKNKKNVDVENPQSVAKKSKPSKANGINFVDLKLTPAEQKSLNDFFIEKQPKTQNEKVLVAMKWFIDDKKVSEVSLEELNYLLSIAAETPSALAQVLVNMSGSSFRWVTKGSIGNYQLSSIGENYVVNKLPKANK